MRPKLATYNTLVFPRKLYLYMLPALVPFLIFWIFPVLQLFYYSFTNFNGIDMNYKYVGFSNYLRILNDGTMGNSIRNTLIYTLFVVIITNLLSMAVALLLNEKIFAKGFFRTAIFLPALFSAIVVGFIWSYIYMPQNGLVAQLITNMGGDGAGFNILGNYKTALYGIAAVEIWKSFGTTMIIYLAGLQTVDESLIEAAEIDGCTKPQTTRYIKLPLISATITINVVLSVIGGLKAFDYAFIMTNGGPGRSTNTLMFSVYRLAFNEQMMGRSSALSVVAFFCITLVTILLLIYMNKREVEL
jgi:raffinose/stachyose/melibiose transport system permease protein